MLGEHWAPEHPGWVMFPFIFQRSLLWLQGDTESPQTSSESFSIWSFSHITPEHMFLDICLPLKNRRLKNVSESWEGKRGGKGQRMQLFQHQDPWSSYPAGSSVSFFLKISFLCCFLFTQAPSYTEGAAQAWQQTHVRQNVQYWVKSSKKPQQLWVL